MLVGRAAADKDSGGAAGSDADAGVGAPPGAGIGEEEGGSPETSEPTRKAWKAWISGAPCPLPRTQPRHTPLPSSSSPLFPAFL